MTNPLLLFDLRCATTSKVECNRLDQPDAISKYVDAIGLKDQMQNNGEPKIVDQLGNWLGLDRMVRATRFSSPVESPKLC